MIYVILYNPEIRLIGPFRSEDAMRRWAAKWQLENGDNPCWNRIDLPGEPIAELRIHVERPEQ